MVVGIGLVVRGESSTYNVLVEFQAKCQIDLLSDSGTAISGVVPLHFDDGVNHFF